MALTKINFSGANAAQPTITLPSNTILQVVHSYHSTSTALTTSFANYIEPLITPSATNSKIFVLVNFNVDIFGDSSIHMRIRRDISGGSGEEALNPDIGSSFFGAGNFGSANQHGQGYSISAIDSPNTTSATEYKIQLKAAGNGSSARISHSADSSVTLMEIKG